MRRAVESLPDIGINSMVQPVNRTVQMLDYKTCRQIAGLTHYLIN